MNRRTFLATTGLAFTTTLAGCTGSSQRSKDNINISNLTKSRKPVSEFLLSRDQLGADWTEIPRPRESEAEFEKRTDEDLHVVNSRVRLYDSVDQAEEKYATLVSKIEFSTSSIDLAVEAVRYSVSSKVAILFRDANAIGKLRYEYSPATGAELPDPEIAMSYAELLYENFH